MCVRISSTYLSETFPILRRNERHTSINVHWPSRRVSVNLIRFQSKPNVVDRFSKNTQISNFMKICLGDPSFTRGQTDARTGGKTTDMTKQTFAIRNFANAPKNEADKGTTEQKIIHFVEP